MWLISEVQKHREVNQKGYQNTKNRSSERWFLHKVLIKQDEQGEGHSLNTQVGQIQVITGSRWGQSCNQRESKWTVMTITLTSCTIKLHHCRFICWMNAERKKKILFSCFLEGTKLGGGLAAWAKGNAVNQRPSFLSLPLLFGFPDSNSLILLWFVPICAWWIIVCFADNLWESSVFWWPSMQIGDIWVLEITTVAPLHLPSCSVSKLTN